MHTAPQVTTADGDTFVFDAGRICLQVLTAGPDLRAWAAEVLDVRELADMTLLEHKDAETLIATMGRVGRALAAGRRCGIGDIARINRIAAEPDLAPQMGAGPSLGWAWPATMAQVLSTIARDAVDVLTSTARDRVRVCEAQDCDLLFVDTSRPGQRRWCSMQRCGNRAKVRAYRARGS